MEPDFRKLLQQKKERESLQKDRKNEITRQNLEKFTIQKIRTTMIGAIASIEKELGFLWGHAENRRLSPEEQDLKERFDKIRSDILDRGNSQIRDFQTGLDNYDIVEHRYQLNLPVVPN